MKTKKWKSFRIGKYVIDINKPVKNVKALSPIIASLILIGVTVAVSIAVAVWMGALTFSFMGWNPFPTVEQFKITKVTWVWNPIGNLRTININVNNTGTKDITISQVLVNGKSQTTIQLTKFLKVSETIVLTVGYAYTNGTTYDISVLSSSGYKFTKTFMGGQNSG